MPPFAMTEAKKPYAALNHLANCFVTGSVGLCGGIAAGIVRDVSPALFGIAAGLQWFTLGSSYWCMGSS
jgi:hypothetical protein